jgi:hypothetical protein
LLIAAGGAAPISTSKAVYLHPRHKHSPPQTQEAHTQDIEAAFHTRRSGADREDERSDGKVGISAAVVKSVIAALYRTAGLSNENPR